MDLFNPSYNQPQLVGAIVCSNSISTSPNTNKSVLYYIIQSETKVPQSQQTQDIASINTDITGTLDTLNTYNTMEPTSNYIGSFPNAVNKIFTEKFHQSNHCKEYNVQVSDLNNVNNHTSQCCQSIIPIGKKMQHLNDRMYCSLCTQKFSKKDKFDQHYEEHHPNESIVYVCSICRNQDKEFNKFRNHYYRHFKKGGIRCRFCPDYRFTQKSHFNNHVHIFHPEKYHELALKSSDSRKLSCSLCKCKFTDKISYDEHRKEMHHHKHILYDCAVCLRSFTKFHNFENHTCTTKPFIDSKVQAHDEGRENNSKENNTIATSFLGNVDHYLDSGSKLNDDIHGFGNIKDFTLAYGLKEDDFNLTINSIDENQNICNILNEDNSFLIDSNDECDIFEKISSILPENSSSDVDILGIDQAHNESATASNLMFANNTQAKVQTSSDYNSDLWNCILDFDEHATLNNVKDPLFDVDVNTSSIVQKAANGYMKQNMIKSKEQYLMCYVCKENFINRNGLMKHMSEEHPSWYVSYLCRYCHLNEHNFDKYNTHVCHVVLMSKKANKRCIHCEQVFKTQIDLKKHTDFKHKGVKISRWVQFGFLCKICNKKLPEKKIYDSHFKELHSQNIYYTCVWCSKHFFKYESFRSHCNIHFMHGKFKCFYCGKGFSKRIKLTLHEKFVHFGKKHSIRDSSSLTPELHSPPSNVTSIFSSDSDSCITQLDIDIFPDLHKDDHISQTVNDDVLTNPLDSMEYVVSGLDEKTQTPFINSPESGIDCMSSPSSEIQSLLEFDNDLGNSPPSAVLSPNSFSTIHSQLDPDSWIHILCFLCQTEHFGKKAFHNHYQMYHNFEDILYGCAFCNENFTCFETYYSHWYQCQSNGRQLKLLEDVNTKNKLHTSQETEVTNCFRTELLSKYKVDNCIESVISTSEDFKHSVICNEYNKGLKYDIIKCNDKSLHTRPAYIGSQDKQTQSMDNCENYSRSNEQGSTNSLTVSSLGDRNMITVNSEDLNIDVSCNKTEDIIRDQYVESFSSNRKQSKIIKRSHPHTLDCGVTAPRNTLENGNSLDQVMAINSRQNQEQANEEKNNVHSNNMSSLQLGSGHVLIENDTNTENQLVKYSPLVLMINVIVSTSSNLSDTNDLVTNVYPNVVTQSAASLPVEPHQGILNHNETKQQMHVHASLRGFRRKPKLRHTFLQDNASVFNN